MIRSTLIVEATTAQSVTRRVVSLPLQSVLVSRLASTACATSAGTMLPPEWLKSHAYQKVTATLDRLHGP